MKKKLSPVIQLAAIIASFAVMASLSLIIHFTTPVSYEHKWKEIEIPDGASYAKGISILKDNNIKALEMQTLF